MTELKRGSVVYIKAGKEKACFFTVLETDGKSVSVADGKKRPIEKPKRKNIKHLSLTNMYIAEEFMDTNKKLNQKLSSLIGEK